VEAAEEFLKGELRPGTWVGVFELNSGLTALHPFTRNRDELIQAARKSFTGPALNFIDTAEAVLAAEPNIATVTVSGDQAPGGSVTATVTVTGGELNPQAFAGAEVANSPGANIRRGELVSQRRQFAGIEGMRQTDQVITMLGQLGPLPGHKTILLFSPGLATTGDPDRFESILNKAHQADISVYAIDIHGLNMNSNAQASSLALKHAASLSRSQARAGATGAVMAERMRQDEYTQQAVRTSDPQASLRALAEGTGGFLIANTDELKKPFERVVEDVDCRYEVAYHPASENYDGHLRRIEVKLARAGLRVESRRGYFAMPDSTAALTPFEVAGLVALNARPRPHSFEFRSAALRFRPEEKNAQYALALEVPGASLTATPEPDQKKHRLHVSLLALVKDANGQVVDKFSQDAPYEVPDEKLAAMQAASILYTHPFHLPPGRYTVETAVLDREGNRSSAGVIEIDNPERNGIGLSDVVLVRQVQRVNGEADATDPFQFASNRVVPELGTVLKPGAQPHVYFVVYPDRARTEPLKLGVQLVADGNVVARQTADLPRPDASGAIPMTIEVAGQPGAYELKITATQGSDSTERSIQYSIAAK
jgi:VWFA-related protein